MSRSSDEGADVLAYWKNLLTTRTTTLRERAERAEAENERLRTALRLIANEDYRGNRPHASLVAEAALSASEGAPTLERLRQRLRVDPHLWTGDRTEAPDGR